MESYPNSNRATLLKSSLKYAERGKPVFPCEPGGKKPLIKDWPNEASTDPRKIHMWWNRWPGANIGIPNGDRSGILTVDHDTHKGNAATLDEVEVALGPISATGVVIETGRGGRQYAFKYPTGSGIRNTTNLLPGVDVRGEGGYTIAPPSVTERPYRSLTNRPLADAPAELLEALTRPQGTVSENVRGITTAPSVTAEGAPIPQGCRDDQLTRIAGRLHDGTRNLDELAAELLEVNAARCEPPLPDAQVVKIARSIHGREPCRAGRPQKVDELIDALSRFWHGQAWKGLAGKSEARFARALITEGRKVGTAIPNGLRTEKSFRQMAEILGVHRNTVGNIVRRGKAAGWLRQDNAGRSGVEAGAFVLVDPRQLCDTSNQPPRVGDGVTSSSRLVADLTTPHFRHRGPVGYSREHTLCILEAHGPQDRESAAELLGWSRPRDLERLHLEPLARLGLLEKRGALYTVPGDHRDRQAAVRGQEYSTVQARVSRERSVEGRPVYVVKDSGIVASETDRADLDRERHERERQAYREDAKPDAHYVNVGADGYVEDLRRVPECDPRLVAALREFLRRNPNRRDEPPRWFSVALWSEDYLPTKPPPLAVEVALGELRLVAA